MRFMRHLPPLVFYVPICFVIFFVHAAVKEDGVKRIVRRALKNFLLFTTALILGSLAILAVEKLG